jgi:hypothetical protein
MAQDLWLEDDPSHRSSRAGRHRVGLVVAVVACLLVIAVPVALVISGGASRNSADTRTDRSSHLGSGPATRHLLSALNATTSSGNFDVGYTFGGQNTDSSSTTTTTTTCPALQSGAASAVCIGGSSLSDQPVTGTAIVDVQPFAMVATSQVRGLGTVVLRDNGTDVWEQGGGDYGLSPGSTNSGPGSLLTGFSSLVKGTLGPRQGALAMLGLASPTGYLNLAPAQTDNADHIGTDTVDGVAMSVYQISLSPGQVGQVGAVPGRTAQEQQATADALSVLSQQGFTGSTVRISIDAAGYIRSTQTTDHFADGTTMTSEADFSNFGCAGTVVMPGQSGATSPPPGCVSRDQPASTTPPSTVQTTLAPSQGSTATSAPPPAPSSTTTPTVPRSSTTSTTSSTSTTTSTLPGSQPPSAGSTTGPPGSGSPSTSS